MLWSLWIIYIFFAEKFKAKTNTFSFLRHLFSSWFIFGKNCAHTYPIFQLLKRTHFWTLPWAPYCIDTPLVHGYLSEIADCEIFQSESSPDLIKLNPIQSWSANVKSCIFILPHEAKELLELFCLSPITIGWRQNTSSSAFDSWGKINTAFRHSQNLTT